MYPGQPSTLTYHTQRLTSVHQAQRNVLKWRVGRHDAAEQARSPHSIPLGHERLSLCRMHSVPLSLHILLHAQCWDAGSACPWTWSSNGTASGTTSPYQATRHAACTASSLHIERVTYQTAARVHDYPANSQRLKAWLKRVRYVV